MGSARRDSVPEILEPAIGDLVRTLVPDEAPTRNSSRELVLGGRNASGIVVDIGRGSEDTQPGLLARGSGPIGSDEPKVELDLALLAPTDDAEPHGDVALIHAPKVELELADLESKRIAVAAKVRAEAELEARANADRDATEDLLLDPWFFKTEEEIAAIEDDPTARIIEIKIAPVLDVSSFDDDRWVF